MTGRGEPRELPTREDLAALVEQEVPTLLMAWRYGVSKTTMQGWLRSHGLQRTRSRGGFATHSATLRREESGWVR